VQRQPYAATATSAAAAAARDVALSFEWHK
jgi:hypothetical protein